MKNTILLFFFIFMNFLNPISLYFTVVVNVVILLISFQEFIYDKYSRYVIYISLFLFLWSLTIMFLQDSFNEYVLIKYLRTFVSTIFIIQISHNLSGSTKKILQVLSIVLFLHITAILLQVMFPVLDLPMAFFFQFDRETEIISRMGTRNLGLTSSYDTASFISVISMIFFLIRYQYSQKTIFLILSFLSLISTMRTSRTGMLIGVFLFFILNLYLFLFKKQKSFFITIIFLSTGIFFVYNIVLPIIASTTDTFLSDTSFNSLDNSNREYTEGSLTGLTTGSHLNAIREISNVDLIMGRGIDPNQVPSMETDIGYIKLIYHVGMVGFIAIFFIYFKLFRKCFSLLKNNNIINFEDKMIISFIMWYIVIVFLFNYKSLQIYSRGTHDLLLVLFFLLINTFKKRHIKKST